MKYLNKFFSLEIMIFIIILIISIYSYLHIFTNSLHSSYSYSELFINYQAGFIRRGLLGEIFWQINKYFFIDPKIFFGFIYYILYLLQIYFLYYICKFYQTSKFFLIFVIFAPQLILFPIYDHKIFFLKDIFIKFTIFFHGYLILKYDKIKYLKLFKLLVLPCLAISILIHEYQILFLSVHILISISYLKTILEIKKILKYYFILIIPILLIFLFLGNQDQYNQLNEILSIFNVELHAQLAGGFKSHLGGFYKWHFYYFSYRDFINLFFSILLSILIPIIIFENFIRIKIYSLKNFLKNRYLYFFLPTFISFLALDHGRNISLIASHFFIFYMTLQFNKKIFIEFQRKINENMNYFFLIILFLFFYTFLWKLDQFAGFGLQGKYSTIFKSSFFAEIIKLIKFLYAYIDQYIFNLPSVKL